MIVWISVLGKSKVLKYAHAYDTQSKRNLWGKWRVTVCGKWVKRVDVIDNPHKDQLRCKRCVSILEGDNRRHY